MSPQNATAQHRQKRKEKVRGWSPRVPAPRIRWLKLESESFSARVMLLPHYKTHCKTHYSGIRRESFGLALLLSWVLKFQISGCDCATALGIAWHLRLCIRAQPLWSRYSSLMTMASFFFSFLFLSLPFRSLPLPLFPPKIVQCHLVIS
jgi:hypothetical protein